MMREAKGCTDVEGQQKNGAITCAIGILTVADAECQPLTEASRSHILE
jgi:hypothetical protein